MNPKLHKWHRVIVTTFKYTFHIPCNTICYEISNAKRLIGLSKHENSMVVFVCGVLPVMKTTVVG